MPNNHNHIQVKKRSGRKQSQVTKRKAKVVVKKYVQSRNSEKAMQVGETVAQLETDIRFSDKRVTSSVSNQLSNQLKEVIVEQPVSAATIAGVVLSYISYALEKGYQANATAENYPYFAFCYITQMILNALQNGVPFTSSAPYWLVCYIQAVMSKSVPMGNGKVSYRFKLDNPAYVPPASITLANNGVQWWCYSPSAINFVDGFPVGTDPSANPLYTTTLGQAAWTSITEFMASSSSLLGSKEHRMVSMDIKTPFSRDVSSFGVNVTQCGGGFHGIGGALTTVQLEVPILHPQFAVHNALSAITPATFRYPDYTTSSAGDAVFLGGFLSNLTSAKNYGMKRSPKFHFVDFGEFVEVVCFWLQGMLQAYVDSPTFASSADPASYNPSVLQCPLTFQEFQLILRNTLMGVFKDTQAAVQSISPHELSTPNDEQFVPFSCGSNSCFLSHAGGMTLPLPLIENLRALTYRYLARKGKLANQTLKDIEMWIPVLGAFNGIALDASIYTFTITYTNGETAVIPVFASDTKMVRRAKLKTSKGETLKEEKLVEPVINIFDGSALLNNITTPVYINDPNRLAALQAFYNDWLNLGLLTFSCGVGIYSADGGPNSLCCINMTRYLYGLNSDTAHRVKDKHLRETPSTDSPIEVDLRLERRYGGKVNGSPYATIGYATTSATNTFMDATYSGFHDVVILPVINAQSVEGTINYDTPFQRWQSGMKEVYSTIDSSGNSVITLALKHMLYASKMYSPITTKESDWMLVLNKFIANGEGGILSSTIAGMIPGTAGAILQGIASLLPI